MYVNNFTPIIDHRGSLISIESKKSIPFEIKRVYYIYDLLSEEPRGFHAHKNLKQIFICLNGSCALKLDNGVEISTINLKNPTEGVFLDKMIWHEMHDFSKNCICLVLASDYYDENDYIRSYEEFKKITNAYSHQ